jgi:hypothetical protein
MKKILDHDPLSGITRTFHYDEGNDAKNFLIETVQETAGLVEDNRDLLNNAKRGFHGEEMSHVARIPTTIMMDLIKKGIDKDPVAFKRWLNDPDNAAFRVKPGVI